VPEIITPALLLYLAVAAFGTAILHSIGGFAGALLMSIAISPVLGIKITVPLVSVAMVVSHGMRAYVFRKAVDWPIYFLLISVALPFILLGVYTYVSLSEAAVGLFLGTLPFLLGAGLTGEALVATIAVQGFMLNLIKTIAFGISPLLGVREIAIGVGLGLCTFPGHYIGHKIVKRATDSAHVLFIESVMLAGALYFISRGFVT